MRLQIGQPQNSRAGKGGAVTSAAGLAHNCDCWSALCSLCMIELDCSKLYTRGTSYALLQHTVLPSVTGHCDGAINLYHVTLLTEPQAAHLDQDRLNFNPGATIQATSTKLSQQTGVRRRIAI